MAESSMLRDVSFAIETLVDAFEAVEPRAALEAIEFVKRLIELDMARVRPSISVKEPRIPVPIAAPPAVVLEPDPDLDDEPAEEPEVAGAVDPLELLPDWYCGVVDFVRSRDGTAKAADYAEQEGIQLSLACHRFSKAMHSKLIARVARGVYGLGERYTAASAA